VYSSSFGISTITFSRKGSLEALNYRCCIFPPTCGRCSHPCKETQEQSKALVPPTSKGALSWATHRALSFHSHSTAPSSQLPAPSSRSPSRLRKDRGSKAPTSMASVALSRAQEALSLSWSPPEGEGLPCRDKELDTILGFCRRHLEEATTGSLYVCGCPGTGKTMAVTTAFATLAQEERSRLDSKAPLPRPPLSLPPPLRRTLPHQFQTCLPSSLPHSPRDSLQEHRKLRRSCCLCVVPLGDAPYRVEISPWCR